MVILFIFISFYSSHYLTKHNITFHLSNDDQNFSYIYIRNCFSSAGYDSKIPGYPRYEMFGDRDRGIFNLHIRNVSLEDDAEFQCQVGQKLINNSILYELNKTVVKLNVICKYSYI